MSESQRNPECVVHFEPVRVSLRLSELGIQRVQVERPLGRGLAAQRLCHEFHPVSHKGQVMWGETVRWLRDELVRTGEWRCDDTLNLPTVMKNDSSMAIAVVRGDWATGEPAANPSTQYKRGPSTEDRVNQNRMLPYDHLPPEMFTETKLAGVRTYLLLHHLKRNRLHAELSLPVKIGKKGFVEEWSERIILGVIDPDGGTPMRLPDESPLHPEVRVRRRA